MKRGGMSWNESGVSPEETTRRLLLAYLGPKHLPYESLIPITIVYSLIFISGIIGNFSTCIVIIKAHYMRTSTNYYLFNLAVSDMLTLIFGEQSSTFSSKAISHTYLHIICLSIICPSHRNWSPFSYSCTVPLYNCKNFVIF
jgi:hypothetical protein